MTGGAKATQTASGLRRALGEFYDQRLQCKLWNQASTAHDSFHGAEGAGYFLVSDRGDELSSKLLQKKTDSTGEHSPSLKSLVL